MEDNVNLALPAPQYLVSAELSGDELTELESRLWLFLGKRTNMYTGGDSSSVRVETAQELIASIWFTLDEYLKFTGENIRILLTQGLDISFAKGLEILEARVAETLELWNGTCLSAPEIENISYRDTLRGIGAFFKHYDYRYFAHCIPCDIDYQLCHSVPNELCGVEYVHEYLSRIITENAVLSCFEASDAIRVLKMAYKDYNELLVNLCEPVIVNAVGLVLVEKVPFSLEFTDADRQKLITLFLAFPKSKATEALKSAAKKLCDILGITDAFSREYVMLTAEELYPRIEAALPSGDLSCIFI